MNENGHNRDYLLVWLRVNGCYLWFNITQIVLAVVLIVLLYFAKMELVCATEVIIAFMIAIDL